MEYLEGETLEQRLIKGPLPPGQTLRYAAQIADALAKAHKLGITHRDLKPANVMLTKSGAKLMDFHLGSCLSTEQAFPPTILRNLKRAVNRDRERGERILRDATVGAE